MKETLSNTKNIQDEFKDINNTGSIEGQILKEEILSETSIKNSEITYKDDSLIKSIIEYVAEQEGISYKDM